MLLCACAHGMRSEILLDTISESIFLCQDSTRIEKFHSPLRSVNYRGSNFVFLAFARNVVLEKVGGP